MENIVDLFPGSSTVEQAGSNSEVGGSTPSQGANCSDGYFYVVVRTDLSLPDQICQVAHAAAGAGRLFCIPEHARLVLLQVSSQEKLLKLFRQVSMQGIACYAENDPDEDQDGVILGFTAFSTRRITEDQERRLFRKTQLWKEPSNG